MSGFDLASLLPCYLDETDEQIAGLSVALLEAGGLADRRRRAPRGVPADPHDQRFGDGPGLRPGQGPHPPPRSVLRRAPVGESDPRSVLARPLLPLPRRPPRLPQGPPSPRREHGRPRRPDGAGPEYPRQPPGPRAATRTPIRSRGAGSTGADPRVSRHHLPHAPVRAEAPLARHEGQAGPESPGRQGAHPGHGAAGRPPGRHRDPPPVPGLAGGRRRCRRIAGARRRGRGGGGEGGNDPEAGGLADAGRNTGFLLGS